jgi:hypothetical protein
MIRLVGTGAARLLAAGLVLGIAVTAAADRALRGGCSASPPSMPELRLPRLRSSPRSRWPPSPTQRYAQRVSRQRTPCAANEGRRRQPFQDCTVLEQSTAASRPGVCPLPTTSNLHGPRSKVLPTPNRQVPASIGSCLGNWESGVPWTLAVGDWKLTTTSAVSEMPSHAAVVCPLPGDSIPPFPSLTPLLRS